MSEEEGQQQRADVSAVRVGVGHDHDFVIAQLGEVEILADARAQRRNQRAIGLVSEQFVEPRALDVEHLAAQRQDRLCASIATLFGRTPGGVAFDDEELGQLRIALRAIGQLARQRGTLERALALHDRAGFARSLASAGGRQAFVDDAARVTRLSLEVLGQRLCRGRLDQTLDLGIAELGLGLSLELRLAQFDRDDGGQALARVLTRDVWVFVAELFVTSREVVDGASQGRAKTRQV